VEEIVMVGPPKILENGINSFVKRPSGLTGLSAHGNGDNASQRARIFLAEKAVSPEKRLQDIRKPWDCQRQASVIGLQTGKSLASINKSS
jgi:hypothetical protein